MYIVTGWRYWYRRYLGWIPVQFCMVCGKAYWGGMPRWWLVRTIDGWAWRNTWQAWWQDCCSKQCCEDDSGLLYGIRLPQLARARCSYCGRKVKDWVDPDWAHGRICLNCERIHAPDDAA